MSQPRDGASTTTGVVSLVNDYPLTLKTGDILRDIGVERNGKIISRRYSDDNKETDIQYIQCTKCKQTKATKDCITTDSESACCMHCYMVILTTHLQELEEKQKKPACCAHCQIRIVVAKQQEYEKRLQFVESVLEAQNKANL